MHTQPQKEGHRGISHTETRPHTHTFVRLCGTPPQRGQRPLAHTLARASGVSAGFPPVRFGPALVDPRRVQIQSPSQHPEPIDLCDTFAPASIQLKKKIITFSLQSMHFLSLSFLYSTLPSLSARPSRCARVAFTYVNLSLSRPLSPLSSTKTVLPEYQ